MALALGELGAARADDVARWVRDDPSILPGSSADQLTRNDAVAVLDADELVGVLVVGPIACQVAVDREPEATDVWLAVRPGRDGEGIATRAGELAVEALRIGGHGRLRATIARTNVAGLRLALRLGFAVVERLDTPDGAYDVLEREVLA